MSLESFATSFFPYLQRRMEIRDAKASISNFHTREAVGTKDNIYSLVHQPVQSVCISIFVMICIKAQCEGNGYSLVKHCNAETDHHRDTRRVALSVSLPLLHFLRRGNNHSLRSVPRHEDRQDN